ncbi:MAG: hypothetical protein U0228_06925 [Myxococcaceae bacterium]
MSELAPWPRHLDAWEPELRLFARELLGALAPLAERLQNILGPLKVRDETHADDPHGYSGLGRRGPWERLLASEWALQLEAPDEFIRRATSGEQLFVELERRSPKVALEAWLLLDTGPAQQGAPRIAQLAALVAFARRAREAGVRLRWAPLWMFELPPHEALTQASVQAWLDSRNPHVPTAALLDRWRDAWVDDGVERDVLVVGSAHLAPLVTPRRWSMLVVDDADTTGALKLSLTTARQARPRTLELALPDEATQLRVLRDPFGWTRPKVNPTHRRKQGSPIPLAPHTELAFSQDGHRLLARTESGSVVAIPLRNTARAGFGWPSVANLPAGARLVSAAWSSKRARGVTLAWQDGAVFASDWDGHLGGRVSASAPMPTADQLFLSAWPLEAGWVFERKFYDARSLRAVDGSLHWATQLGDGVVGLGLGGSQVVKRGLVRQLYLNELPLHAVLGWSNRLGVLAMCTYPGRVEMLAGHQAVRVRTLPAQVFDGASPVAVCATLWPNSENDGVTVIAVGKDGRTIRSLDTGQTAPQWIIEARARAQIEVATAWVHGEVFAWRDVNGEIGVHSRTRKETVLRLHVRDAGKELP